jgi:ribosomal protein L40E
MGRRRLVGLGLGLGTVAVGLFILADQAWVGSLLQPYIGSALGAGDTAAAGLTPYGSLSYIVYAIGFGLVVSGIGLARSVFRSSVSSYVSGGGPAAMGMNPGAMENMMKTSLAQVSAVTAATTPKETVKVKCRNCGSLEPEDAVYCNKCGKPL